MFLSLRISFIQFLHGTFFLFIMNIFFFVLLDKNHKVKGILFVIQALYVTSIKHHQLRLISEWQ